MLFNSYIFIFIFLPITLLGFYLLGGKKFSSYSILWLTVSSLFFYAWWNPIYLSLILISIGANYYFGRQIEKSIKYKKLVMLIGVTFNLILIVYYKYANFFIDNINTVYEFNYYFENATLPLGISFFTFQQIAYLVDKYRACASGSNFFQYILFVSFFPQLIAGPIVHHNTIIPQFSSSETRDIHKNVAIGISIFIIGLFKKVVLADSIAVYVDSVFDAASAGITLTIFEAWSGSLAYTLQLYFDFSGYSDMALGLGMLFGVRLPINFLSPYKSTSIIDFWSRWHITLSQFLKDYVYIPLGGNRKGKLRRYQNLMITMLLGGLWHGAGWTFVIWGGLHGLYLIVNHGWRAWSNKYTSIYVSNRYYRFFAWFLTFIAIVFSWVVFRADSMSSAVEIYKAMLGFNGISIPIIFDKYISNDSFLFTHMTISYGMFHNGIANWNLGLPLITFLIILVMKAPNTIELFSNLALNIKSDKINSSICVQWNPSVRWAFILCVVFIVCIEFMRSSVNEFLYFQF